MSVEPEAQAEAQRMSVSSGVDEAVAKVRHYAVSALEGDGDAYYLDVYNLLVKTRLLFFSVVCIAYTVGSAVGGFVQELIAPYMLQEWEWYTSIMTFYVGPVLFIFFAMMVDALFDLWLDTMSFPILLSCRTALAYRGVKPWAIDAGFIAIFEGIPILHMLFHVLTEGSKGGSPNLLEAPFQLVSGGLMATWLLAPFALYNRILRRTVCVADAATPELEPIGAALLEHVLSLLSFDMCAGAAPSGPDDAEHVVVPRGNGSADATPLVGSARPDEEEADLPAARRGRSNRPRLITKDAVISVRTYGLVDWKAVLRIWGIVHALMLLVAFVMHVYVRTRGKLHVDDWQVLAAMCAVTFLLVLKRIVSNLKGVGSILGSGYFACVVLVALFCFVGFVLEAVDLDLAAEHQPLLSPPPLLLAANDSANESEPPELPPSDSRYPVCVSRWGSDKVSDKLTVMDLGMFSFLVYQSGDNKREILGNFTAGTPLEGTAIVDESPEQIPGAWKVFSIPRLRTRVVAVRGTLKSACILYDMALWAKIVLMQVFGWFVPMFTFVPVYSIRYAVGGFDLEWTGHKELWDPLLNSTSYWLGRSRRDGWETVITGHSLGGGLSAIVGAHLQIPAITFSAPGEFYSMDKFHMKEKRVSRTLVNVVPQYDLVPLLDKQAGVVQHIECGVEDRTAAFKCHSLGRTMCELYRTCGDTRARQWMGDFQPEKKCTM